MQNSQFTPFFGASLISPCFHSIFPCMTAKVVMPPLPRSSWEEWLELLLNELDWRWMYLDPVEGVGLSLFNFTWRYLEVLGCTWTQLKELGCHSLTSLAAVGRSHRCSAPGRECPNSSPIPLLLFQQFLQTHSPHLSCPSSKHLPHCHPCKILTLATRT